MNTTPTKTLSANAPDDVINALVAEHVAKRIECCLWRPFNSQSMIKGECGHEDCIPVGMKIPYATSADAVLPLLDKAGAVTAGLNPNSLVWRVQILTGPCGDIAYACRHRSFARAASLALLMANGFTIANQPAT